MTTDRPASGDLPALDTMRPVQVVDMVCGSPPSLLVVERVRNTAGRQRTYTQEVKIFDLRLYQRLLQEVRKGDEILARVITEFGDQGYTTYLADYQRVGDRRRSGE